MSALTDLFKRRTERARKEQGLTIAGLAAKAGFSHHRLVSLYRHPGCTLDNAVALASALGLSLDALVAPSSCDVCDGLPPAGFTCQKCGTHGPGVSP